MFHFCTISSFCIADNVWKLQISNFFEKDKSGLGKLSIHFQCNKNKSVVTKMRNQK